MNALAHQHSLRRKMRYKKARETARHLAGILSRDYHAKRVVLIGSLTNENTFDVRSDIDLCVSGLDASEYFKAVGEMLIEAGDFSVDLIPIEDATPRMAKSIEKGETLYDAGR